MAREVSELLPRWEAAAYLTDPALVCSRARQAGLILWTLVALLTVSIAGGGTLVLRALAAEVRLARQKSSFVANVSHELKTPLTSIRMYAEMLQEGRQRDPARRRQYLGTIVEESRRLTRLVNRVLDFARLERGGGATTFGPLDLGALCRGVLENERPRLEQAGFAVDFEARGWRAGEAEVRGDPEALAQVLLNLLSNAEKYSGERRQITVELAREAGKTRIRVLDRGRGIPPGAVRHLFKEFYRADDSLTNPVQGTGLGLAIARRIVRDHGGRASVFAPGRAGAVSSRSSCHEGPDPDRGGRSTPGRRPERPALRRGLPAPGGRRRPAGAGAVPAAQAGPGPAGRDAAREERLRGVPGNPQGRTRAFRS